MKKYLIALVLIVAMFCSTISASAAPDPAVVIVNPYSNSTIHSNNLLISVKITGKKMIKVNIFEEKQMIGGTWCPVNINTLATSNGTISKANFRSFPLVSEDAYTSAKDLSFYTKQINNVSPGLYRIQIDTIDGNGKTTHSSDSVVVVKEKVAASTNTKIFETPQSGTLQFLQGLLKTIFGN